MWALCQMRLLQERSRGNRNHIGLEIRRNVAVE